MRAAVVVLLFVLVVAAAWLVRWAARARVRRAAQGEAQGEPEDKRLSFPYRHPCLPTPSAMFYDLAKCMPRTRREKGFRRVLVRTREDAARSDSLADHYTEEYRVRAKAPGRAPLWEIWKNAEVRGRLLRAARKNERSASHEEFVLCVRDLLESGGGAVPDTNPAFVAYVVRLVARKARLRPSDLRVVDAGAGWGGQLLGACAADVATYHAYMPYQSRETEKIAASLEVALSAHRPPETSASEFWVRVMEIGQACPDSAYDVVFVNAADLTPVVGGLDSPACRALRPGGFLVMFVGPGRRAGMRALDGVEIMRDGGMPLPQKIYGVRTHRADEGIARALIWKVGNRSGVQL